MVSTLLTRVLILLYWGAMPALSERQQSILDAVIREYVLRPEPVASEALVRKHRLPYSPATVRSELQTLEDSGYLTQPHTSAGRTPTDKGYRFFIHRMEQGEPEAITGREERALASVRTIDDPFEFVKQASRILAELTRSAVIAGLPEDDLFYKAGIGEAMQDPEFAEAPSLQGFSLLLDELDDAVDLIFKEFVAATPRAPRIFIGRENPIPAARPYGMIIAACDTPFHREGVVVVIGPKRMDYRRNISLLGAFQELTRF